MSESDPKQTAGRVSIAGGIAWGRLAAALAVGFGAAGALLGATMQGTIASSFAVSGSQFQITADRLEGTGFQQWGGATVDGHDEQHYIAPTVLETAKLYNLCQSAAVKTPVGDFTMVARAGQGDRPVEAKNMVIDLGQLDGDATFTDMEIGRDASTLSNTAGLSGPKGGFSQGSKSIRIDNAKQTAYGVNAGTFALVGLQLRLEPGSHPCF